MSRSYFGDPNKAWCVMGGELVPGDARRSKPVERWVRVGDVVFPLEPRRQRAECSSCHKMIAIKDGGRYWPHFRWLAAGYL